jgi:hypothetical protein
VGPHRSCNVVRPFLRFVEGFGVGRGTESLAATPRHSHRAKLSPNAVTALNHPNICWLYDVGPNYIVTEYLDGDC